MKEEIEALKKALGGGGGGGGVGVAGAAVDMSAMIAKEREEMKKAMEAEREAEMARMREELEANRRLLEESSKTWEQRVAETAGGLTLDEGAREEIQKKKSEVPHLLNLHEDALLDKKICHLLESAKTVLGRKDSDPPPAVPLGGIGIRKKHCTITRDGSALSIAVTGGKGATICINGKRIPPTGDTPVQHGDRVLIGNHHVFVAVIPVSKKSAGNACAMFSACGVCGMFCALCVWSVWNVMSGWIIGWVLRI